MTAIVGYVHNNNVYIGGDSAGIGPNYSVVVRNDPKVFNNGPFVIGFTSSFRMGQLLHHKLKVPKQTKTVSDYEYMCTTFVDAVRECLSSGGYTRTVSGEEKGGKFLVGYKNRLYGIDNDFQVSEARCNYMAAGCGANYALGAMYVMSLATKPIDPQVMVKCALKAAAAHNGGVCAPFKILCFKDKTVYEWS